MSRWLRQSLWQVPDKPICVALMEFSLLQCMGKVRGLFREVGVMEFGLTAFTFALAAGAATAIASSAEVC